MSKTNKPPIQNAGIPNEGEVVVIAPAGINTSNSPIPATNAGKKVTLPKKKVVDGLFLSIAETEKE